MIDIRNLSDREIQEVINACNDEFVRRKMAHRASVASGVLDALEELVKIAPYCYIDMSEDPNADEDPVYFKAIVKQWEAQNFHFD